MTPHLPELAKLPADAVLDGELVVALGDDGWPDFPRLCQRMLQGARTVPVVFVAVDLLELNGRKVTDMPLDERRSLLDSLRLPRVVLADVRSSMTRMRSGRYASSTASRALLRSGCGRRTDRASGAG